MGKRATLPAPPHLYDPLVPMPKATKAASASPPSEPPKPARRAAQKAAQEPAAEKAAGRAKSQRAGAKKAQATVKRPAAAAKAGEAKGSGDRFLQEQRALLLSERDSALRQANALQAEAEQLAQEMEPGDIQFDEESGEGGTMNVERERDLALSAQARAAVEEIERALDKIDAGTYGICDRCGQPIPRARLKALPYAALCVACKSGGLSRR